MSIASVKTIRSLERGLAVVRLLRQRPASSLAELHATSGLPKATLERILLTLQHEGFASQRIADGRWVPGHAVVEIGGRPLGPGDRLGQAAAPVLKALCQRVIWPSDLSVRVGTHMELTETSRAHSRLTLTHIGVGFPIDMLMSAPGRAYLSNCPDDEREMLLGRLLPRRRQVHGVVRDRRLVERIVAETRAQGFGARDPRWGGHISKPKAKHDDGLDAIAVPVMHGDRVLGCLNIVWIRAMLTQADMARRHLRDLQGGGPRHKRGLLPNGARAASSIGDYASRVTLSAGMRGRRRCRTSQRGVTLQTGPQPNEKSHARIGYVS
jgi:IclR family mhp operon transcriptional activator